MHSGGGRDPYDKPLVPCPVSTPVFQEQPRILPWGTTHELTPPLARQAVGLGARPRVCSWG